MNDMKGLWNTIRKGPITFVLIYADWCGHCHSFMPHFKAASKGAQKGVGTAAINEKMLNAVNAEMQKNVGSAAEEIKVQGYPTLITVDNSGRIISEVETVRDTPKLTALMNKTAKALNGRKLPNSIAVAKMRRGSETIMPESAPASIPESAQEETMLSMAVPPSGEEDELKLEMPSNMANASLKKAETRGGSLYGAMSAAAYQLAPAGVLMALAAKSPRRAAKRTAKRTAKRAAKRTAKRRM